MFSLLLLLALGVIHVQGRTYLGTTVLTRPYMMRRRDSSGYEGCIQDILDHIHRDAGLNYTLYPVPDGSFGHLNDEGEWTGTIGELVEGNADMALAPLVKTPERESVVDFSKPFILDGLAGIVRKPADGSALPFSNFEELISMENTYSFGTVTNDFVHRFINDSSDGLLWQLSGYMEIYPQTMVDYPEQGVQRALRGNYVYLATALEASYVTNRYCDLTTVSAGELDAHFAYRFAVRKGDSELQERLNWGLLRTIEEGSVTLALLRWWEGPCSEQ